MLMRRFAVIAAALLVLPACNGTVDSDPPEPVLAEEYIGEWTLKVAAASNCWPQFEIKFNVTIAHVDAFRGQTTFSFEAPSGWWRASSPAVRHPLTMSVNGASDTFLIRPGMGSPAVYASFAGDGLDRDNLVGNFSDPEGVFRTIAGTRPCEAFATATRAG